MASIQSLIVNLFRSNTQKLAAFRGLCAELDAFNANLQKIQVEKERLASLCEAARQKMFQDFSLANVKDFSTAAAALDDFTGAASVASNNFAYSSGEREKTPRAREICFTALGACREILEGKLQDLLAADGRHAISLGLDAAGLGDSAATTHLRGLLATVNDLQNSLRGENPFSWGTIRAFINESFGG